MGVLGVVGNSAVGNGIQGMGNYDVKRKTMWEMKLKSTFASPDYRDSFTLQMSKAARPSFTVGEVELQRGNERWFVASKPAAKDLSVGFYDALPSQGVSYTYQTSGPQSPHPAGNPQMRSASQLLYNWYLLIYNPSSGSSGYASEYQTDAYITLYAGNRVPIERWLYIGLWPREINMGDLDYANEGEALTIDATFRYNKVYRIGTGTTVEPLDAAAQLAPETPEASFNIV